MESSMERAGQGAAAFAPTRHPIFFPHAFYSGDHDSLTVELQDGNYDEAECSAHVVVFRDRDDGKLVGFRIRSIGHMLDGPGGEKRGTWIANEVVRKFVQRAKDGAASLFGEYKSAVERILDGQPLIFIVR